MSDPIKHSHAPDRRASSFVPVRLSKPIARLLYRIGGAVLMVFVLGLSLLPLAALLMIVPAVYPNESVLSDSTRRKNKALEILWRVFSFTTGVVLLVTLLAFAVEFVTRLNLKSPYFGKLARMVLPDSLAN